MSVQSRPDGVFPREVGVSGQRPVEFLAQAAAAASPAQQQTGWDAVRTARQAIQGFDTGGLTATDLHNARRALVDSMGSGLPKPLQENQESMLGQIDRRLQAQQAQAARQAEARNQQGAQLVRDLRESIGGFDRGAVSAQSLRDARTQANDFLAANQGRLNQTTEANLRSFLAQSKTRLDNAAQTGQQQQAARQLNASLNTHVTTLRDAIQAYDRAPNAGTRRALNDAAHEANAFAGRIRNDQVDQLSTAGIENLSSYRAQAMRRLEASSPQRPAPAPAAAGGATAAAGAGRDRYGEPEMIQTFQSGRWRGREVAVYQVQNRESGA